MNNYVKNRNEIKSLIFERLYEQSIDDMTNQKLNSVFDELEFFNDTIKKDPLHFSAASIKFMDAILENEYIKTYGFESFVKEYTKFLIEEFDNNTAHIEDFKFELDSISESIKYNFSKLIPNRVLTEEVNGINNEDVKNEFKKKIQETIDILNELRISLKYYRESYIKNVQITDPDKKSVMNKLKQYLNTACVSVDKFISFMNTKFNKEIDKNNGSYFTDKRNKDEFYLNFDSFQVAIAVIAVAIINIRIIAGDNEERPGIKIPTTQVQSVYGYKNRDGNLNLSLIIKSLTPGKVKKKLKIDSTDYFSFITDFVSKTSDKNFYPLLRYFFNDNRINFDEMGVDITNGLNTGSIGTMTSSMISREQSLSFKFVHHLDQLLRGVIDLSKATKRLIAASQNRKLNEFLTGSDIENIANRMRDFISSSNKFNKDLEIMIIGGATDLVNIYNQSIAINVNV